MTLDVVTIVAYQKLIVVYSIYIYVCDLIENSRFHMYTFIMTLQVLYQSSCVQCIMYTCGLCHHYLFCVQYIPLLLCFISIPLLVYIAL